VSRGLERMWKEAVMPEHKVLSWWPLPGRTEETMKGLSQNYELHNIGS
jgi:hypothetical protein